MNKGHTIIELLIALTILSIFYLTSAYIFGTFRARNNSLTEASQIFHIVQFARNQAITRQQTVAICGSADQQHCSEDWSKGYMVYVDSGKNQLPRKEDIIFIEDRISPANITSYHQRFKFIHDGRSVSRGSIEIRINDEAYRIVILDSGRSRLQHSID